jgi:hypothetical protein
VLRLNRSAKTIRRSLSGLATAGWQTVIPKPNGEIVTTRYALRALLDKLDELLSANPGQTPDQA